MIDRPILFSAPMVRAILREIEQPGTGKTQTRRVLNLQPDDLVEGQIPTQLRISTGDRLYVREAHHRTNDSSDSHLVGYDLADGPVTREDRHHIEGVGDVQFFRHSLGGWGGRTSRNYLAMHMPRWASRITLNWRSVGIDPVPIAAFLHAAYPSRERALLIINNIVRGSAFTPRPDNSTGEVI